MPADGSKAEPKCITKLSPSVSAAVRSASVIPSIGRAIEELLLNSIDAGATCVDVHILQGKDGNVIEVHDNGIGIDPKDFKSLGESGATSKLALFGSPQLHAGQGLQSLCSVAERLLISSKRGMRPNRNLEKGSCFDCIASYHAEAQTQSTWEKEFIGGHATRCGPAVSPRGPGTTVRIEKLLDGLPVRSGFALQLPCFKMYTGN